MNKKIVIINILLLSILGYYIYLYIKSFNYSYSETNSSISYTTPEIKFNNYKNVIDKTYELLRNPFEIITPELNIPPEKPVVKEVKEKIIKYLPNELNLIGVFGSGKLKTDIVKNLITNEIMSVQQGGKLYNYNVNLVSNDFIRLEENGKLYFLYIH